MLRDCLVLTNEEYQVAIVVRDKCFCMCNQVIIKLQKSYNFFLNICFNLKQLAWNETN